MSLSERMAKQGREQAEKKKKFPVEEDEETLTYAVKPKVRPLDTAPGPFQSFDEHSINTEKSVFDRTALFHTAGEEEQKPWA